MNSIVRVGIVDDHRVMQLGTTAIINGHPGLHVVAVGTTVAELLALQQRMDVILLDLTLSDGSTPSQNMAALSRTGARILAFVAEEPPPMLRQAARAGAVGLIRKSADAPQIIATIRAAARGQVVAGAEWLAEMSRAVPEVADAGLSVREAEVLALYAAGNTAESVAQGLYVSRATVLDHIRRIRAKYAAAGRPAPTKVDLFRRAVEDGLVQSES
ncbi:helix-turn-helix transcriptional regulator [Microbacterium sp. MYb72]|nr:helix-turn-helix transcriptional regulator [Microbacterium sp. MYb72]